MVRPPLLRHTVREETVSLGQQLKRHVVEPPVLRIYQWRGDPLAMMLRPATKADPYPLYADLRRRGLVRSPLGSWVTARHETAATILRDRRFSTSPVHRRGYRPPAYPAGDPRAELPATDMLTMDPPDHTRLRRLVSSAFTPRAVAGLEPWIRAATDQLLEPVDARAGFDVIDALALPLPIAVICHLLGVPRPSSGPGGARLSPHSNLILLRTGRSRPARRNWP
jgi:cytochrome P450